VAQQALFEGLVVDESERPVSVAHVGGEAFYVVDDDGFERHIESEAVDRQVLREMTEMIEGHEDLISKETMKLLGQEDIFTKAMIEQSLSKVDENIEAVLAAGLPEAARMNMGMMGFRVVIDLHGNLLRLEQPTGPEPDDL
jgi:PHD/YefM family antitoxin component YafN of YafNO toxin-antitoxin module